MARSKPFCLLLCMLSFLSISSSSLRSKMARSKPFCLLLCMLAFLSISSSFQAQAARSDFFYLTLTWPGTQCSNMFRPCCMPTTGEPAIDFLVESMETYDSYSEKIVTNCNSTCSFYVNQLRNFIGDMYQYWPDVNCPSNNGASTWKATFCEYGPCSNLTQQQYFERALALRKDLNLLTLLGNNGIVPSNTKSYDLADIESALRTKYPFSFVLQCNRPDRSRQYNQLYKIRYCVSMDGKKFITCPITKDSNCASTVKFPVFTYNMLKHDLSKENEMKLIEMPTSKDEIV